MGDRTASAAKENCYLAIDAVYEYLCELTAPRNIFVFGRSIGSGPSVDRVLLLQQQSIALVASLAMEAQRGGLNLWLKAERVRNRFITRGIEFMVDGASQRMRSSILKKIYGRLARHLPPRHGLKVRKPWMYRSLCVMLPHFCFDVVCLFGGMLAI